MFSSTILDGLHFDIDANDWSGDRFQDLATKAEVLEHYSSVMAPAFSDEQTTAALFGYDAARCYVAGRGTCVLCTPNSDLHVAPAAMRGGVLLKYENYITLKIQK